MMRRLLQIAVGFFLLSHAATHSAQAQTVTGKKASIKIIYSALTASKWTGLAGRRSRALRKVRP
jgi:hypothetical protein